MSELRVLHVWADYAPDVFDQSHPFCLENGIPSRVVAGTFIGQVTSKPPAVYRLRTRSVRANESARFAWRALRRVQRILFWPRLARLTRRHVSKFSPTVVHFHFATTAAGMPRLLRGLRVPVVVSLYGVDASAALRDKAWEKGYRAVYEVAKRILVLSEGVLERLVDHGCPRSKVQVLNLPAGVEKFPFSERKPGPRTRFLIAARFVEKKGYPTLLRALKRVVKERTDVHLTMFGYGDAARVRDLVRELQLEDFCTLIEDGMTDFVDRFRRLLAENDVFVLPSTTSRSGDDEGGPALTLVAAQAAGMPVIATAFPGAELSVVDQRTGLITDDDDASLASCMLAMCGRPDRWKTLGREGSRLAVAGFSREGQCRRLLNVYREVANGTGGGRGSEASRA